MDNSTCIMSFLKVSVSDSDASPPWCDITGMGSHWCDITGVGSHWCDITDVGTAALSLGSSFHFLLGLLC